MTWEPGDLIALCFCVAVLSGSGGFLIGLFVIGGEWAKEMERKCGKF